MLAILLIPAALCFTFGRMVGDTRQGWAVLAAMTLMFVVAVVGVDRRPSSRATRCSPRWASTRRPARLQAGGNMEGKETRFGIADSALLGDRHDGRLERLGQLDARLVHAAGRPGADVC